MGMMGERWPHMAFSGFIKKHFCTSLFPDSLLLLLSWVLCHSNFWDWRRIMSCGLWAIIDVDLYFDWRVFNMCEGKCIETIILGCLYRTVYDCFYWVHSFKVHHDCHTLISFTCPHYCLHPLQVLLVFPSVFIPVFPVSLCQFVLYVFKSSSGFSRSRAFYLLLFLVLRFWPLPVSGLYTHLPDHSAWLDPEPVCHSVPLGLWSGFDLCLSTTILLPTPFGLINIVRLQPSSSCVCIWVSPCVLIMTNWVLSCLVKNPMHCIKCFKVGPDPFYLKLWWMFEEKVALFTCFNVTKILKWFESFWLLLDQMQFFYLFYLYLTRQVS